MTGTAREPGSLPRDVLNDSLAFLGDRLMAAEPLGPLCTYRVGGPARWFVEVADVAELSRIATALARVAAASTGIDPPAVLVVGRGSNLLVCDAGFDGLVLQLGERFGGIDVQGSVVTVGGAASLPVVARRTVAEGLTGFEWAVGVPGSIGGAVRMNAGGHGSDMAASLRGVRVVDLHTGETQHVPAADLALAYRSSAVAPHQVVVAAELQLETGDRTAGESELADIVRWRREHQPGGHNAGSVFANPPGDSAGRLIEAAGARGLRVGSAEVSEKHANFIQADEGGSADDVFALMVSVAALVQDDSGVALRPETRLVGFGPFPDAVAASRRGSVTAPTTAVPEPEPGPEP